MSGCPPAHRLVRIAAFSFPALALAVWASPARAGQVAEWKTRLVTGCWSCDTVNEVTDIGLGVAETAFNALSGQTATLLGLLMGLWILFFAGRLFLPFGPDGNEGSLWNEGAKKLFRFAVVLAFLQGSQSFWDYVFIPLMSSGMGISASIMEISDPYEADRGTPESEGSSGLNSYCGQASDGAGVAGAKSVMHQIDCPLAKIQSQFAKGILVGIAVFSGDVHYNPIKSTTDMLAGQAGGSNDTSNTADSFVGYVVKTANNVIAGIVLIIVYFFGFLLYPLLLIDVVMRVSVITVVSPLAIAAAMFRPTQRIAEKAVWHLVQAALTLAFASVVAGIGKALLAYTFSNIPTAGGLPLSNWKSLVDALEAGQVAVDLSTASFYTLIGVGVLLIFMLRESSRMAHEFTGASGGDFTGAGTAVARMAGVATRVGGTVAQAVVMGRVAKGAAGGGANASAQRRSDDRAKEVAGND